MAADQTRPPVAPLIRELLDSFASTPAFVRDRYLTVLESNRMARAVSPDFAVGVNLVRAAFLETERHSADEHPSISAGHLTGVLRQSLADHELDEDFESIVGELSRRSASFLSAWADGSSRDSTDTFTFPHTAVGPVTLEYEQLAIPNHFDQTLVIWRGADDRSRRALERLRARLSVG